MHYLLYPTDRCNLRCAYCDTPDERECLTLDRTYSLKQLKQFFEQDKERSITFYGGEPTLDIDYIKNVMDMIDFSYISIITNGMNLHKIPVEYLNRMDMVSISLDGDREHTDKNRGKGSYDTAINAAKFLKSVKYKGLAGARVTVTFGTDIHKEIMHLIDTGLFDMYHWQIDFFHQYTLEKTPFVKKWLSEVYNPGINRLIKYWVGEMNAHKKVIKFVPLIGIMHTMLQNGKLKHLRCGAGDDFVALTTTGEIYSCPLLRGDKKYLVSDISKPFNEIKAKCRLKLESPCPECDFFDLCGGRCFYTNDLYRNAEIFDVICSSVRHLIFSLNNVKDKIKLLVDKGYINVDDFIDFTEHEVIP